MLRTACIGVSGVRGVLSIATRVEVHFDNYKEDIKLGSCDFVLTATNRVGKVRFDYHKAHMRFVEVESVLTISKRVRCLDLSPFCVPHSKLKPVRSWESQFWLPQCVYGVCSSSKSLF